MLFSQIQLLPALVLELVVLIGLSLLFALCTDGLDDLLGVVLTGPRWARFLHRALLFVAGGIVGIFTTFLIVMLLT